MTMVNVDEEASTTADATYYFDDIYIDDSWARVEIGNNSVYDNCTHREMQIPSVWSAESITVMVNQGSFANGAQVYIYVVDDNGMVSPGYGPITIGASVSHKKLATGGKKIKTGTKLISIAQ